MQADIEIYGGTLVTPSGTFTGVLSIKSGTIAAITTERVQSARRSIDATGLHILPGMIDGHVHFFDPGDTSREDFICGSSAAALGGITTVIEHTHSHPVRTPATLEEKAHYLRDRSVVDFGLAAHVWEDDLPHVAELWRAGAQFFKIFTCATHGVPAAHPALIYDLLQRVALFDGLVLVHCEDDAMTAANERALRAAGHIDPALLPQWRSREAEQVAVNTVALLATLSGARVVVAHVSHPAVVALIQQAQQRGARIRAETCPQYMYLAEEELTEHGPFRKFTPPMRSRAEGQGLWEAIAAGGISHISTDHAPSTREQKAVGCHDLWQGHFGLPGVQTTLPLLLEAVNAGYISLPQLVHLVAETPARLYGLWPRKGHLQPGADADLVLVDLQQQHTLDDAQMVSKAGWTPYHGLSIRGRPVMSLVRGTIVVEDGTIVAPPGTGIFLSGPGTSRG